MSLTQTAYNKFSDIIRPGGLLLSDSRFVQTTRKVDARQLELPLYDEVMEKIGKPIVYNICTLGALIGITKILEPKTVLQVFSWQNIVLLLCELLFSCAHFPQSYWPGRCATGESRDPIFLPYIFLPKLFGCGRWLRSLTRSRQAQAFLRWTIDSPAPAGYGLNERQRKGRSSHEMSGRTQKPGVWRSPPICE